MQTAKQKLKRAAPWLFLLLVLAGLAAVRGLAANYEIGYEIMNGDFQNYNPVRHLLAGQIPYRDFTVYLGAGELYSVGGLLLVLGNSFGRSMFATNFCTWFYFELLVLAVCLVVIGTARAARAAALALCSVFFAYVQGANLPFAGQVNTLLSYAAANGNSARMMRSAALTLAVLVILLGLHFCQQDTSRRLLAPAVLVPFAAGFFVPWSNDMGGAAYISIALGYGLYLIRLYRGSIGKIVVQTLRYIVTSVVGLGVSVLLISWGHPLAWLRQTRGTSAYQTWYYGNTLSDRVCSVADLHWPGAAVFCLAAALAFAIGIFVCRSKRSAVLAAGGFALTLGMVLWNLLYGMVSASNNGPTGGAAALAPYVPEKALKLYKQAEYDGKYTDFAVMGHCELALLRAACTEQAPFAAVRGVSEGLEHRLENAVRETASLPALLDALTTVRYPRARMRRLAMDAALGYTAQTPALPPYLHLLGARKEALPLLGETALPLSHSLARLARENETCAQMAAAQSRASDLGALCRAKPEPMGGIYRQKIIFLTN